MSNATTTDVKDTTAPVHSSKHGCCGGEAASEPRTDALAPAGHCGGPSEPHHHAQETTSAPAGSCCCGGAASDSSPAGPKAPGVKSK